MASDLEIIKQLEKEIRIELRELEGEVRYDTKAYKTDSNQNVTGLYLNYTGLKEFPLIIMQLKNLTELYLYYNQLSTLPGEIYQLKNLTKLYLYNNQLSTLPGEITQLKNLTVLDLSGNQLTGVPGEITQLKNLTKLYLYSNQLAGIPGEISRLKNLTKLYLSNNLLSTLPGEITWLENLTELGLSLNHLTRIPGEITWLENLTKLDLRDNKLTSLPEEITKLNLEIKWEDEFYTEKGINLYNNPLESPPVEIVKKGRDAVIEYFKSLEEGELPLNEVKVLLVGDGGAGKTSLVKQLLGDSFDKNEPQTHGINIRDWNVEDINVHFWDFGGQEIMHATHQFFLSKRSLYILVLDGRKEEKTEYWLKHIESFGGDSPVLVVLNKMDENPGFDVNRRFLQEKYKGIEGFYPISCKKKKGIEEFKESLDRALNDVEILKTTWPKRWFAVKTQIEKMAENFISYEQYKEICSKEKITGKSTQDTLVDFLNDLGVILHFKEFELEHTHVLEPRWVTEAVYKIINSETLAKCRGVLRLNCLDDILKKEKEEDYFYPHDKYKYIIDLMKKFEICYKIDGNKVLTPDLLAVQEPEFEFNFDNSLKFVIDYDFLPKSVMPRFIVKMHRDIKEDLRWRTGVVLEDEDFNSTAVVVSDDEAKKVYIYVNGKQRRDYFSVILSTFREINRSFEKLKAVEKVPLPDDPEVMVSYKHLITLENKGTVEFTPDGSEKEYKVKDLLGNIYVEKKSEEEILRILRKLKGESDDEETLLKKAEGVIIAQPTIMGFGIDLKKLKALVGKLFNKDG